MPAVTRGISVPTVSTSASTTRPAEDTGLPRIRGLIASHRAVALAAASLVGVMVAIFAFAAFGSKAGTVSDATTCSQWGSANQDRQTAYARLYVREHGPVSARWGAGAPGVINAINAGCAQAFGEDVSDSVTVVQAVSRNF